MNAFPGIRPFIVAAAEGLALSAIDTHQATRLDAVRKAEQVLGQLAGAKPEHRDEILANVRRWRGQLAAALAGLDAALASIEPPAAAEASPSPSSPTEPEPAPKHRRGRDR